MTYRTPPKNHVTRAVAGSEGVDPSIGPSIGQSPGESNVGPFTEDTPNEVF